MAWRSAPCARTSVLLTIGSAPQAPTMCPLNIIAPHIADRRGRLAQFVRQGVLMHLLEDPTPSPLATKTLPVPSRVRRPSPVASFFIPFIPDHFLAAGEALASPPRRPGGRSAGRDACHAILKKGINADAPPLATTGPGPLEPQHVLICDDQAPAMLTSRNPPGRARSSRFRLRLGWRCRSVHPDGHWKARVAAPDDRLVSPGTKTGRLRFHLR